VSEGDEGKGSGVMRGVIVVFALVQAARIACAWWLADRLGFDVLSWADKAPQPAWLAVSLGAAMGLSHAFARAKWMPVDVNFEKAQAQSRDFGAMMSRLSVPGIAAGCALWSTSIEVFYRGLVFQWLAVFAFDGSLGLAGALGVWALGKMVFLRRLIKTERPQMVLYMLAESLLYGVVFWWTGTIAATLVAEATMQFFTYNRLRTLARRAE
jgi:hypothetical protein